MATWLHCKYIMSTLYFIRHGQASFGKENYDELSEKGRRQAALLAGHFNRIGVSFDVIYSGTLSRHTETAREIIQVLEYEKKPIPEMFQLKGLNEYDTRELFTLLMPAVIKNRPALADDVSRLFTDRKAFQNVFEEVMSQWASGIHDVPGMMKWKEFAAEVNAAIAEIMNRHGRGRKVAVCTSGGPISVAVQGALHLSDHDTMNVTAQLVNTSVTRFKCTTDRIMMATFNEYVHLELNEDASLVTYR